LWPGNQAPDNVESAYEAVGQAGDPLTGLAPQILRVANPLVGVKNYGYQLVDKIDTELGFAVDPPADE
jgi:hypothetical protein